MPGEVEISYGDLCNKEDLERFFETPEGTEVIVLHIASIVTVNPDYSQKVMDVNVGGTENIIEMCKEHNVSKLVYCSSTGAIPEEEKGSIRECEGSIPLDPETALEIGTTNTFVPELGDDGLLSVTTDEGVSVVNTKR